MIHSKSMLFITHFVLCLAKIFWISHVWDILCIEYFCETSQFLFCSFVWNISADTSLDSASSICIVFIYGCIRNTTADRQIHKHTDTFINQFAFVFAHASVFRTISRRNESTIFRLWIIFWERLSITLNHVGPGTRSTDDSQHTPKTSECRQWHTRWAFVPQTSDKLRIQQIIGRKEMRWSCWFYRFILQEQMFFFTNKLRSVDINGWKWFV